MKSLRHVFSLTILSVVALFTRLWRVDDIPKVVWDEAYFGPHIAHTLARRFYFDVHPPLGKSLLAIIARAARFDASFSFRPGHEYPDTVDFAFLRRVNGLLGAACVPIVYMTARNMHFHGATIWLVTMMVLLDHSYATIARFILLDTILLFFTLLSIYFWTDYCSRKGDAVFSRRSLSLVGICVSMGLTCSIKWSGAFTMIFLSSFICIESAIELKKCRRMLGSWKPLRLCIRLCIVFLVPGLIYIGAFVLHFPILHNSGPDDGVMSSRFQYWLRGSRVGTSLPTAVIPNQTLTLKNFGYGGGLLHSSDRKYPRSRSNHHISCTWTSGSISTRWKLIPLSRDRGNPNVQIQNGTRLQILNGRGTLFLSAQQKRAPITMKHNLVAGIAPANTSSFVHDTSWVIEVDEPSKSPLERRFDTIFTTFRLRHLYHSCYLSATHETLPQWALSRIETSCSPVDVSLSLPINTLWNIEEQTSDMEGRPVSLSAPNQSYHSPRSMSITDLARDLMDIHAAMWYTNKGFSRHPDRYGKSASKPWQWPLLWTGMRMTSWGDGETRQVLLGNPFVYWLSAISLAASSILAVCDLMTVSTQRKSLARVARGTCFLTGPWFLLAGWLTHFVPYTIMDRPRYLHHYLPALIFAILATGDVCERMLMHQCARRVRMPAYAFLYGTLVWHFWYFRAVTFGMDGPCSQWRHLQWMERWNII